MSFKNLLIVGLTLGTAWAVRGQFGHEQGAAWAGGIGCLAILVIARRDDWNRNLFGITLAGAIGWGLGGMMSYGLLVGNGHKFEDPGLTFYSLAMLFIVGALHGILGGGLFGLALLDSKEKPVHWIRLTLGMISGGAVSYFAIITLLNWRMTPPRSEAWAVCFGFAIVLTSYLIKTNRYPALRVAGFAGLGAGFGFALGNVIHALGIKNGIQFNFWNVMEYSIGLFGGIGFSYAVFTADWPKNSASKSNSKQLVAFLFLALLIPTRVWSATFGIEKINKTLARPRLSHFAELIHFSTLVAVVLFAAGGFVLFSKWKEDPSPRHTTRFFAGYFSFYILLSLWLTGSFFSTYRIEQYLYPLNFFVILLLLRSQKTALE